MTTTRDRAFFERQEAASLASYAMRSADSRGRTHHEEEHAFRLAFQRDPTAKEQAAAEQLVRTHGLPAFCRALFNANEFAFIR